MFRFQDLVLCLSVFAVCTASAVISCPARAQDVACQPVSPSKALPYHAAQNISSGQPTDAGVEAPGFIVPPVGSFQPGVGVSKYQDEVDFSAARDCGAKFVMVRLSAGTDPRNEEEETFKPHWRNAKGEGLLVEPYHNLTYAAYFAAGDVRLKDVERKDRPVAIASAENAAGSNDIQATMFLDRLKLLLGSDTRSRIGAYRGKLFLDPVLDLTTDPWRKESGDFRDAMAPVITAAACRFVTVLKADPQLHIKRVVVFTTPDIWRAYHLDRSACGLGGDGIALSVMTLDGGPFITSAVLADICLPTGTMRCLLEHYTSYTSFLNFGRSRAAALFRFYGTEQDLEAHLNAID